MTEICMAPLSLRTVCVPNKSLEQPRTIDIVIGQDSSFKRRSRRAEQLTEVPIPGTQGGREEALLSRGSSYGLTPHGENI